MLDLRATIAYQRAQWRGVTLNKCIKDKSMNTLNKTIAISAGILALSSCGQDNSSTLNSMPSFSNYDWSKDSGMSLVKKGESNGQYEDITLDTFHVGQTLNGKFLHNMAFYLDSYVTDGSIGHAHIEESFEDMNCVKSKYRPSGKIRRYTKVVCESVFATDQRPEMIFGAPMVTIIMKQNAANLVDVEISIDRGYDKEAFEAKGLKVDYSTFK
jgi:hypothetical protein